MEHGFYHPDAGYWQTIIEPSEAILATYPEGTVEVPLKPVREGYAHEWDAKAQEWVATKLPDPEPVEPDPTPAQLQAAIEAVAKAAGLTDQALDTVMESVGLSRRAEAQPVEPGPVIGGA